MTEHTLQETDSKWANGIDGIKREKLPPNSNQFTKKFKKKKTIVCFKRYDIWYILLSLIT
jgi:hypothetical protein